MGALALKTPIPPRRQAERTALSDARMLEAAVKLIVGRGTEGTTLKEVGELAGYSRGLAGYRFGSKGGLYAFVVKSIGEEWLKELTRVTEGKVGLDALVAATDAHHRFCVDAPDHVRAFYILWFESIGPGSDYRDVIAGIHRRRQRDVIEWIRRGIATGAIAPSVDAAAVAGQFCASITGIVYQWLVEPAAAAETQALYDGLKKTMHVLLTPAGASP
jgi:AcrR family transcriptional regulator